LGRKVVHRKASEVWTRVTKWACEKVAQTVGQHIFRQI
jgi:ABC-type molybdate transport system ATPase subunit